MQPLVLLHGFTGSPVSFRSVMARLPLGQRVTAVTLPGHDDSPPPRGLEDALAVIDEAVSNLGGRAHLAGYSLGGRLALHYAVAYPERVSRLTLFGARPGLEDPDERLRRLDTDRRWSVLLRSEGLEVFLERWEAQPLLQPRTASQEAVVESKAIRRRHRADALAAAMEAFSVAALPNLWPRLESLGMPVRWVAGEHDATYRALIERAAAAVGEMQVLAGCGHAVLIDDPDAVAECLSR